MKKHAIIPIFIPHMGCKESCVFCDQKQITARSKSPSLDEVRYTIDEWLTTLGEVSTVEIAFYGGSFTAIPESMQNSYLSVAKEYLDNGLVQAIHLSTRPDAIDDETLDRLISYGVKTVELGVQSFSDEVLLKSERGHDSRAVYEACDAITKKGLNLGIQLMVGLPGDSLENCIFSAKETVRMNPKLARIYPTLVLKGTPLMEMYKKGLYTPLTREEALAWTKAIYEILLEAGITIMRVGLKSTDIINNEALGNINEGAYHPAFRQLVESEIAKEKVIEILNGIAEGSCVIIKASPSWISNLYGHKGENKEFYNDNYPLVNIEFKEDTSLTAGEITIEKVIRLKEE